MPPAARSPLVVSMTGVPSNPTATALHWAAAAVTAAHLMYRVLAVPLGSRPHRGISERASDRAINLDGAAHPAGSLMIFCDKFQTHPASASDSMQAPSHQNAACTPATPRCGIQARKTRASD